MNQVSFVGRLVRTPELRVTDKKKMTWITIAVTRGFKNLNGEYETDFIDCVLWDNVAISTVKYCKKGDIISVRGRIQSRIIEKDNEKKYVMEIIGEKITFISSANRKEKPKDTEEKEVKDN